jgi:hypothetical protein
MQGLPSEAFDMLVRTLARICDDPYDPVFSAPVPPMPSRRVADLGDFGFIESSPMRRNGWSASITSYGPVSDHPLPPSPVPLTARNIYRKLAATRRGEAVRRARQLKLI